MDVPAVDALFDLFGPGEATAVAPLLHTPEHKPVPSNSAMAAITATAIRTSLVGIGLTGRGLAGRTSCQATAEGSKSMTIFHDIEDNLSKCLARAVATELAPFVPFTSATPASLHRMLSRSWTKLF
ncbi:MAG TPA: hypothetical protein VGY99_18645 [Candidatus Binataceae bacterium]|nr:hypothetical protein [Candidatus Binataceae bacterium]